MTQTTGPTTTARHALTRRAHHRLLAGVASGVGEHFNIEPNLVRLGFVVLALRGRRRRSCSTSRAGCGLPKPSDADAPHGPVVTTERRRSDWVQVAALGAVVLGVLLLSQSIGLGCRDQVVWPLVLAAMGTALIVGRSGRPIDELISELIRRERGLDLAADPAHPTPRRSSGSSSAPRSS